MQDGQAAAAFELAPGPVATLVRLLGESGITTEDLQIALAERAQPLEFKSSTAGMIADCTPKQQRFVLSKAPRKLALKGRRAGGSYGTAVWLLQDWEQWGGRGSLYVARTLDNAKHIIWDTLLEFNERYELGAAFNASAGNNTMRLPNGYTVRVLGAKDQRQVDHMRGYAKGARRVAIDEAGYFSGEDSLFRYMVKNVLQPQLMDTYHLGGGQMALIGNAGPIRKGFYHEVSMGILDSGKPFSSPWELHYWTALDNTAIDAKAFLVETLEDGSMLRSDTLTAAEAVQLLIDVKDEPYHSERWQELEQLFAPEFLREYMSRWVDDPDAVIYHVRHHHLVNDMQLPTGVWRVAIGIDVGWGDGNAFTVVAKMLDQPTLYVLESYYIPAMDSAEIAAEGRMLQERYRAHEVYVDTGGEGGKRLQDLANHGLHAEPQAKGEKKQRIEYGRSLLRQRRVLFNVARCQHLTTEMTSLPWCEFRRNHREGYVDDCTDSWLAACWALNQAYVPAKPPRPRPGTEEHERWLDEQEHKRAIKRAGRRRR